MRTITQVFSPREEPYEFNPRPLHALIDFTHVSEVLETIEDGVEQR